MLYNIHLLVHVCKQMDPNKNRTGVSVLPLVVLRDWSEQLTFPVVVSVYLQSNLLTCVFLYTAFAYTVKREYIILMNPPDNMGKEMNGG